MARTTVTLQLLQAFYMLATGKAANTAEMQELETLVGSDGNLTRIYDLIDAHVGQRAQQLGVVGMVQDIARNGLGLVLSLEEAAVETQQLLAIGIDSWSKLFIWLANHEGTVGQAFDNRGEAADYFAELLGTTDKSGLFAGSIVGAAVTNLLQNVGASTTSLDNAQQGLTQLATNLSAHGILSSVVDGYISGATVFVDSNGDGLLSAGEWHSITDASGNYVLPLDISAGTIIAFGGIDILTKLDFQGVLTAAAGSTVINPITTLIQAMLDSGEAATVEQATTAVQVALGLPADINLLSYDPLAILADNTASLADRASALAVQTIILQLANVMTQAANAIHAASITGTATLQSSSVAVAAALAGAIGSATGVLDLGNVALLTAIIEQAAALSVTSEGGTQLTTGQVAQIAAITAASNAAAAAATTITELSQVAVVTQGSATDAIINGTSNGNLADAVAGFTGVNLDVEIAGAHPGFITPEVPVPQPDPGTTPDLTFAVTVTGTVVTFGGTATGEISIAITNQTATFTREGLVAATVVDNINLKTITLAAGQTLVVSAEQVDLLDQAVITGAGRYKVTDSVSIAQLAGIAFSNEWTGTLLYSAVSDVAANLDDAADSAFETTGVNVTVIDAATLEQLGAIDALWGTVTPTTLIDTAANLAADSVFHNIGINVTVSSSATLAQIAQIDALWGTVTFTSIADKAVNLGASSAYANTAINVTVTDASSIAQLIAIDALWGTVTPTMLTDTAANLAVDSAFANAGIDVTVANAATLAQIAMIDTRWGTVTYYAIADTVINLSATSAYSHTAIGVTVTDAASLAQLTAVDALWGAVTATSVNDTAANLAADSAFDNTGTNVRVTDAASLAQLDVINGRWGAVTATTVADTRANLITVSAFTSTNTNVTVTDAATLAQLTAINVLWGTVTPTTVTDTAANLAADSAFANIAINVTVSDIATLEQIAQIDALWGTVTFSALSDVADTAANLAASEAYANIAINVTVTDAPSIAQLTVIDALWGVVTWTSIADTAAHLASDSAFDDTSINVLVTDAASLAQLGVIDERWGTVTVTVVADTVANLTANSAYANTGTNVTVTDVATIEQLTAIDALWGTVTPGSLNDTAANLAAGSAFPATAASVTVAGATTIAQLTQIDALWGTVAYEEIVDTAANLAVDGPYTSSTMNVTVTDTATVAQLQQILTLWGNAGLMMRPEDTAANFAGVSSYMDYSILITDSASLAQLAAIKDLWWEFSATSVIDTAANLAIDGEFDFHSIPATVTGAVTIAQLQQIDELWGTLGYTTIEDTVANLAANTSYNNAAANITVTGHSASAGALLTIYDSTNVVVDVGILSTITGDASEVIAVYAANTAGASIGLGNEAITVSGIAASAADVQTILAATTGPVTIGFADTHNSNAVFTVDRGDVISIDDLNDIADFNPDPQESAEDVNNNGQWHFANEVFTWWDSAGEDRHSMTLIGATTIEVGPNTITMPLIFSIAHEGDGAWTIFGGTGDVFLMQNGNILSFVCGDREVMVPAAEVTALTLPSGRSLVSPLALLTPLTTLNSNVLLTDTGTGQASALNALDTITTGMISAPDLGAIAGTAAAVMTTVVSEGLSLPTNYNVTLTGIAAATDISAIEADNGTGTIDGLGLTAINGTAAAVLQALADLDIDPASFNSTLDGMPSLTQLQQINALSGDTVYTAVADSAANLAIDSGYDDTSIDVTVTDAATLEQLDQIDALWGAVSITSVSDTAAHLVDSSDAVLDLLAGIVTATGNATVAQAIILSGFTKDVVYSISDTAIALASANSAVLNGAVNIAATGQASVAHATTIEAATNTGTTSIATLADTATALSGSSDAVLAQVTDAITVDDLAGTDVAASVLSTLGGRTMLTVTVSNALNISGTPAQVIAALLSVDTLVQAATAAVTITQLSNMNVLTLTAIHAKTSGTITLVASGSSEYFGFGAYTGDLIINNVGGSSSVTTGSGHDVITGGIDNDGSLSAGAGNDTLIVSGASWTEGGSYNGAADTDTLRVTGTAAINISGDVFTSFEILDLATDAAANSITMTVNQHNAFTTAINADGGDRITLSSSGVIATDADPGAYSVVGGSSVTIGTAAGHLAQVITETGIGDSVFTLGAGIYTGDWEGIDTDDVLRIVDGTNIAGNAGLNSGAIIDFQNANGTLGLNFNQHSNATLTNLENDQTLNIAAGAIGNFSGKSDIEAYIIGDDSDNFFTFTVGTDSQDVTATSATDRITFAVGGRAYTGTLTGMGAGGSMGADAISLTNGANIAGATLSGISSFNVASGASVTLTAEQLMSFSGFGGGGTQTINLTTALTTATTLWSIYETYVLAAGDNIVKTDDNIGMLINANAQTDAQMLTLTGAHDVSVTLTAGDLAAAAATGKLTVTATTGSNVITTGSANDVIYAGAGDDIVNGGAGFNQLNGEAGNDRLIARDTDVVNGGADTDTVLFGAAVSAANLSDSDLSGVEFVEIANLDHVVYDFSAQTEGLVITGNDWNNNIIGGAVADIINTGAGNDTITGGAGVDIIDIGTGKDIVIVGAASSAGIDLVSEFEMDDSIGFTAVSNYYIDENNLNNAEDLMAAILEMVAYWDLEGIQAAIGFTYNDNSYVFIDAYDSSKTYDDADAVVQLVGVDLTTLTIANFSA